jgi:hypothetical protein
LKIIVLVKFIITDIIILLSCINLDEEEQKK